MKEENNKFASIFSNFSVCVRYYICDRNSPEKLTSDSNLSISHTRDKFQVRIINTCLWIVSHLDFQLRKEFKEKSRGQNLPSSRPCSAWTGSSGEKCVAIQVLPNEKVSFLVNCTNRQIDKFHDHLSLSKVQQRNAVVTLSDFRIARDSRSDPDTTIVCTRELDRN